MLGPGQMFGLFVGRVLQGLPNAGIDAGERLPLVKSLCADFADMIDAHQRRRLRPLPNRQGQFQASLPGRFTGDWRTRKNRAQSFVKRENEMIRQGSKLQRRAVDGCPPERRAILASSASRT